MSAPTRLRIDDEQFVVALAESARLAVENARRYQDSERRRRWQAVTTEASQALFAGTFERPVDVVLGHAMMGGDGDLALLGRLVDDTQVEIDSGVGALADQLVGTRIPLDDSVTEPVFRAGKPVLVEHYVSTTGTRTVAPAALRLSSVIAVPLQGDGQIHGALAVGRMAGRKPFDRADLDQLAGFANHAGIAMQLDRARTEHEKLRLLQDHDRIATELHAGVVQELFAIGMGLEGMVNSLERPEQRTRVLGYVDDLDATIRRIRNAIFQLLGPDLPGSLCASG